jgi:hypothetical protein
MPNAEAWKEKETWYIALMQLMRPFPSIRKSGRCLFMPLVNLLTPMSQLVLLKPLIVVKLAREVRERIYASTNGTIVSPNEDNFKEMTVVKTEYLL